jgi:hypothetical protein
LVLAGDIPGAIGTAVLDDADLEVVCDLSETFLGPLDVLTAEPLVEPKPATD